MISYEFGADGLSSLTMKETLQPIPMANEVIVAVKAMSINYRDLMIIKTAESRGVDLPAVPVSDGSGVVVEVGAEVNNVSIGDSVMTHFIPGWVNGPYDPSYAKTTLGTPGAGLATELAALPSNSVVPIPAGYDFLQASTLPIAGLTAWSSLFTEGNLQREGIVLILGTGGVSIFALQIAKAFGAKAIVLSKSNAKLAKATQLGADYVHNYAEQPNWDEAVMDITHGQGVDVVVEAAGIGTLSRSLNSVRGGGVVSLFGVLTGLEGDVSLWPFIRRRARLAGIFVDSRNAYMDLVTFIEKHSLTPIIDSTFEFNQLKEAFARMQSAEHFGKIVIKGR